MTNLHNEELSTWRFTGDVSPIEHGGLWIKETSENSYDIVKLQTDYDGTVYFAWGTIDLDDSWIDIEQVESYGGCKKEENVLWFIDSVLNYYGSENFCGNPDTYKLYDDNELIESELLKMGIKI